MSKILPFLIVLLLLATTATAQPDSYEPIFHVTGGNPESYIGYYISNCGDQNGDGADELLLSNWDPDGVSMFYGGSMLDSLPDLVFGEAYGSVRSIVYDERIGSLDYGNLLISQIHNGYNTMYMYDCGSELDTIFDMSFQGEEYNDGFGSRLCTGDFNGDGWNDIITSAPSFGSVSQGRGKLYVYYGGPELDNVADFTCAEMYNNFGSSLGSGLACGDVNGDGFDDILAMCASPRKAYLFYGGAEPDSIPDWSYMAEMPTYLTTYCEIAPHLNGDQYSDMMFLPSNASGTYLFYGGEIINDNPDQIIYASAGFFINAGDLNGDSLNDVLGRNEVGSLILPLYSSPDGPIEGESIYTPYDPESIGFCGDVNGDGFDDLAYSSNEPNYFGQTFVYADTTLDSVNGQPSSVVRNFELLPAYPNPFNSSTTIPFTLDQAGKVELKVYDVLGRSVGVQYIEPLQAGKHEVVWNAEGMASGVYFIQLQSENQSLIQAVELIK